MAGQTGIALALAALLLACEPAPTVLSPDELIEAFVAHTQAADRTMHLEFRMDARYDGAGGGGAGGMSYSGSIDAAGTDYRGLYSWNMDGAPVPGEPMRIEVVSVNGRTWQRDSLSREWMRGDDGIGGVLPGTLDPFGGLAVADLEYAAVDDPAYDELHRLSLRDSGGHIMRLLVGNAAEMEPHLMPQIDEESTTGDIYVDGEGIPVVAEFRLAGRQDLFGTASTFRLTMSFAVSDWGAPIAIMPPAP